MSVPTNAVQLSAESPADMIEDALMRAADAWKIRESEQIPSILNQLAAGILTYQSIPKRDWPSEAKDGLFLPSLSNE